MKHSYSKIYLNDAQQNLAVMFDYALRTLKYDGDQFFLYFIQSEIAEKFGHANPKYINQASGQTINNLARALCCNFYEIMEIEINE